MLIKKNKVKEKQMVRNHLCDSFYFFLSFSYNEERTSNILFLKWKVCTMGSLILYVGASFFFF